MKDSKTDPPEIGEKVQDGGGGERERENGVEISEKAKDNVEQEGREEEEVVFERDKDEEEEEREGEDAKEGEEVEEGEGEEGEEEGKPKTNSEFPDYVRDMSLVRKLWSCSNTESLGQLWYHLLRWDVMCSACYTAFECVWTCIFHLYS